MVKPQGNHLQNEHSPYLLQHAGDPVDWYPWSEEAFEKALADDKPVFLSIGYSTCHWCHRMHEESFSDHRLAALINSVCVPVKVDREERPDVDSFFVKAVSEMTGSAGWPLHVFLTPDKKLFYGGTYFPPGDRWGTIGLETVMRSVAVAWKENRGRITASADSLMATMRSLFNQAGKTRMTPEKKIFGQTAALLKSEFDPEFGGFGSSLKFPSPSTIFFLLRHWHYSGDDEALAMAEKTLTAMAGGGIYDQLGGGLHRYSTDRQWRLPHFEKMLYDQALGARAYLEAYQATKKEEYLRIGRELLDFIIRDMDTGEGVFSCAFDADSPDPQNPAKMTEGGYYLWTAREMKAALEPREYLVFKKFFGVTEQGNTGQPDDFGARNILYRALPLAIVASEEKISEPEVAHILASAKRTLLEKRKRRPALHIDDKVLADWNSLAVYSLALCGRLTGDPVYSEAAERCGLFIIQNMSCQQELLHSYRDGKADIGGFLDDYAFLALALIELYQSTADPFYLNKAVDTASSMVDAFWDKKNAGFFLTSRRNGASPFEQKEIFDTAVPSGNSVAFQVMVRLSSLTSNPAWRSLASEMAQRFFADISLAPLSCLNFVSALYPFMEGESGIVVVEGEDGKTGEFLKEVNSRYAADSTLLFIPSDRRRRSLLGRSIVDTSRFSPGHETHAFACGRFSCGARFNSAQELKKLFFKERPGK